MRQAIALSLFTWLALVAMIALISLAGCSVTVDKRTWTANFMHAESRIGSATASSTNATTNTSDTKTDATQAIEGSLDMLP